jgi:hypothetical protein
VKFLIVTAVLAMAAILPGVAPAQPRRDRGRDIARVIADCEERTNQFRRSFRYALDRSAYRDSMREDELNRHADRLERAMNRVRESWNRERNPGKTRYLVSEALTTSQEINRAMMRGRLHPEVQKQWFIVRSELNRLAEVFEVPKIRW